MLLLNVYKKLFIIYILDITMWTSLNLASITEEHRNNAHGIK